MIKRLLSFGAVVALTPAALANDPTGEGVVGFDGALACAASAINVCVSGVCGASEDFAALNVDFTTETIETCWEGVEDACTTDQLAFVAAEEGPGGRAVLHLGSGQSVFSISAPNADEDVEAGFVMTSHALRTVITLHGSCRPVVDAASPSNADAPQSAQAPRSPVYGPEVELPDGSPAADTPDVGESGEGEP